MKDQLVLFELPGSPQKAIDGLSRDERAMINWSYSRRSTFEKCARLYYYDYYGSRIRVANQEPQKATLRLLKSLQTRHKRAGNILHMSIGAFLRKRQEGKVWLADSLIAWARDIFRSDIEYSSSHPDGDEASAGAYPPSLLAEFYYREPNAYENCAEVEAKLVHSLASFANGGEFDDFRVGGSRTGSLIERPFKIRDVLPCRVEGKIDLAYAIDTSVTIVDWKLGVEDGTGDDSLQLATYALWAVHHYHCSPEAVHIFKAHLGSSSIVLFECSDSLLAAARARIAQDVEQILALDRYGREGIREAFTPCSKPKVCRSCVYRKVCLEVKEAINA